MQSLAPLGSSSPARAETPPGPGGSPFCEGDGVSGSRIQAVYGHLPGTPDNYATSLPTFRTMASAIDDAFDMSAGRQGGSAHPRWAFEPGTCNLSVLNVELPAGANDNFNLTIQRLTELGLRARTDRKYIVWVDADGADNLIAQSPQSTDPNPATNPADGGQTFATVAQLARNGGWDTDGIGGTVLRFGPQHELGHMLGAVNPAAPHSIPGGHCSDDLDAMCFSPDPPVCPGDFTRKLLLDCNADDYFAVSPAPGSYPANNWNIYNSSFLVRTDTPDLPPDTAIDSGPSGTVDDASAQFGFSSSDAAGFECSLDGGAFAACSSPQSYTGLGNGAHDFQVRAVDAAGNRDYTPAQRAWTVDRQGGGSGGDAPDTRITGSKIKKKKGKATFEFEGSGGDGALTFECSLDGKAFGRCSSPARYKRLKRGRHTFAVRALDAGGADPTPAEKRFKSKRRRR